VNTTVSGKAFELLHEGSVGKDLEMIDCSRSRNWKSIGREGGEWVKNISDILYKEVLNT
jgi:hypothetical protein